MSTRLAVKLVALVATLGSLMVAPRVYADAEPEVDGRGNPRAQAKAHFDRATVFFDDARYLEAAHEYEAAQQALDLPAFLFNIGQAYRMAGQMDKALAAYRAFVARAPTAPERAEADQHIAELAPRSVPPAAPAPAVAAPVLVAAPAPTAAKPAYKKWWVWTLVGVSAAAVGVGVGLGVTLGRPKEGSFGLVPIQ